MKSKVRLIGLCVAGILFLTMMLGGCGVGKEDALDDGRQGGKSADGWQDAKLKIVTTIFPAYDWTREILGERAENVELTLLLDQGVDMHSYEPTVDDIIRIGSCDLFIYVGGESDEWVEKVLRAAVNPEMRVINLLAVLGEEAKKEEVVEGMETKHGHGEEINHGEEEYENDEHVWLSVRNAQTFCGMIADMLAELDEEGADEYLENAKRYGARLEELEERFQETVEGADKHTLLFADRFPFRYLTEDCGLEYYAAFPGCEAETEASFETITFLAGKVDELELPCVLTIEGSDQKIAVTVVANTQKQSQEILAMDSMQSVTAEEIEEGTTYLSVMEQNRNVLERALMSE